jgi:cytochrome bd-type quinol oxidase subunit 2
MADTELINDNFFTNVLNYDYMIVLVLCSVYFIYCIIFKIQINGVIKTSYILAIICLITSGLHYLYNYMYLNDTDNTSSSTITYTNNMLIILTVELFSFIVFIILFIYGFLKGGKNETVIKKNNS